MFFLFTTARQITLTPHHPPQTLLSPDVRFDLPSRGTNVIKWKVARSWGGWEGKASFENSTNSCQPPLFGVRFSPPVSD
eukprot:scaffold141384_cov22-Tisochrysis_lutea.AAC.1